VENVFSVDSDISCYVVFIEDGERNLCIVLCSTDSSYISI
jgi:hypothetical protein